MIPSLLVADVDDDIFAANFADDAFDDLVDVEVDTLIVEPLGDFIVKFFFEFYILIGDIELKEEVTIDHIVKRIPTPG